jgi:hypothetical protein
MRGSQTSPEKIKSHFEQVIHIQETNILVLISYDNFLFDQNARRKVDSFFFLGWFSKILHMFFSLNQYPTYTY